LCFRFCIFNKTHFRKDMFFKLKRPHTCSGHAYVQCGMVFLLQLRRCTFFLESSNYQYPRFINIFNGLPP
jgi:hypothetical protein